MAFDWNEYLVIAKDLKTETNSESATSSTEAKQRTAVSRAYYAVFHLAKDFAKDNLGYEPKKYGPNQDHSDVRGVYRSRMDNPDYQEVGKILFGLHKARKNCDYDDDLGNPKSLLDSSVIQADKIQSILTS